MTSRKIKIQRGGLFGHPTEWAVTWPGPARLNSYVTVSSDVTYLFGTGSEALDALPTIAIQQTGKTL